VSIAGFKASNHPQQTAVRGAADEVDDRETHPENFDPIAERFGGFTLDVAAAPHNAKCTEFFTRDDNGLLQPWAGRVWCNPPYSDLRSWVQKAWDEWGSTSTDQHHQCCALELGWNACSCDLVRPELIVMLLPANRVEQKWWQELVEPYRDRPGSPLRVEFLPGRMRFIRPNATIGPKGDRPPFGCCLLIWQGVK
jgi:hypothetical protein